jgi:hypothetical protein
MSCSVRSLEVVSVFSIPALSRESELFVIPFLLAAFALSAAVNVSDAVILRISCVQSQNSIKRGIH